MHTDPIIELLEEQVELLAEESRERTRKNSWDALPGLSTAMARTAETIAELCGTASDKVIERLREQAQLLSEANDRRFSGEMIMRTEAMMALAKVCIKRR